MADKISKVALVTGAAKRIGKSITESLVQHGWSVAIHHNHSQEEAQELIESLENSAADLIEIRQDLNDHGAAEYILKETIHRLGAPELLINNASLFNWDDFSTFSEKQWDEHFAINARAPIILGQQFAQFNSQNAKANIINILDQRVLKPTPNFFSYTLSKSALWTATKMMAQTLAPNIRVNAIGPGPTLANSRQSEEDFTAQCKATLLEYGSNPEEICRTIQFILATPSITGQMIALDGGQHLTWQTPDAKLDI